jgi:hypothetical protein
LLLKAIALVSNEGLQIFLYQAPEGRTMNAWLLVCLLLTIQLPNSSGTIDAIGQQPETPRFWVQSTEKQSNAEPTKNGFIIQTSLLPAVGAAQFDLVFNPEQLKQPELIAGNLLSNALLESNLVSPGRLRVAFVSSEPITGPGELVFLWDANTATSPSRDFSIRLENAKAWKSVDSSEVAIDLNSTVNLPAVPAKAVAKQPIQTDAQVTTLSPSSHPMSQATTTNNTVTLTQPTPLQVQVQLTLPGWFTFAAGALTTLVIGSLILLWMRKH